MIGKILSVDHCTLLSRLRYNFKRILSPYYKAIEDVIISSIPQSVKYLVGVFTSILIARGLGPEGMGNYALILSVANLSAVFSDLGIVHTSIRFASRAVAQGNISLQHAILRWAFRLRISIVLLVSVIIFILTPWIVGDIWHARELICLVRVSLLISIFNSIYSVPTIYFVSARNFRMNSVISIGQTIIPAIGILLIGLQNNWSVDQIVAVSIISSGICAFVAGLRVPSSIFFGIDRQKKSLKTRLNNFLYIDQNEKSFDQSETNKFAFFAMISSIAIMITLNADIWLMGFFLEKNQIGVYSVASRITLPFLMLLGALNTALWPRVSSLTCQDKIKDLLFKTLGICLLIAIGGVIYSIFMPYLIPWLFGKDYIGGIFLAQILSIRYCLAIIICPLSLIGYSFGLARLYCWVSILQLIAVVGINVLLLPTIGPLGSALAFIASELISLSIIGTTIWRKIAIKELPSNEPIR